MFRRYDHPQENVANPRVEVIILDGAAITNMLAPGGTKTFSDYATHVFLPYITSQLQHAIRVDVVWDEYMPDSLNAFRFLAAHEMSHALGPDKCRGLPAFHAFTGCDTVSSFGGRSKKTAWETWKACDEVTSTVCALGATPTPSIVDDSLDTLERFVVLLYDRTSNHEHVNDASKQLFTKKGRAIDALPPTREALRQHIRRTA